MKNSSQTSESKDSSPTQKLKLSLNSMMAISSEYLLADLVRSCVDVNGAACDPDLLSAMTSKMMNKLKTKNEEKNSESGLTELQCLLSGGAVKYEYTGQSFTKTLYSHDSIAKPERIRAGK